MRIIIWDIRKSICGSGSSQYLVPGKPVVILSGAGWCAKRIGLRSRRTPTLPALPMGGRAFLMCFRTLPECENTPRRAEGAARCKGSFDCDLTSASRKASLRSG